MGNARHICKYPCHQSTCEKDVLKSRIAELENLLKAARDFITDEHIRRDIDAALGGSD